MSDESEHKLVVLGTDEPAHHDDGPSSLALKELCAMYLRDNSEQGERAAEAAARATYASHNDAADEGTALHLILETGVVPDGFPYTEEHQLLIANTIEERDKIIKGADEVLKEVRLYAKDAWFDSMNFGTTDVLALFRKDKHIELIDYKMGLLPVEPAETNIQGWNYALAAFQTYPWAETVTVSFIALRVKDEVDSHTFSREAMPAFITRIRRIIERKKAETYTPHPEACQFCARVASCEALSHKLLPLAKKWSAEATLFDDARKIDLDTVEQIFERDPDQVGIILRMLDVLNKARDEVRDFVKTKILQGTEVKGYDVYTKALPRKQDFTRDRDVIVLLMEEFGVDPVDLLIRSSYLRRSKVEAAIRDVTKKGQKDKAVQQFRARAQELGLWYDPAGQPEGLTYVLKAAKRTEYTGLGLPGRIFGREDRIKGLTRQVLSADADVSVE